ncbi:MAG: PHP domain-containing protein [Candidatus Thorarchaeota archaeon]|nr:MAG: PHP domain-containing protein [Candidatus Thorarchaeota archaeon]
MVRARADLHTHSFASDGSDSPTELVRKANKMNLGGIALTDHDTLSGIKEFMDVEVSDEMIRIPGVEISCEYENREVHILGYFVPLDSRPLNDKLEFLRKARYDRLPQMVQKLVDLGLEVTIDELYEDIKGVASPGRPHVAQLLMKKGIVTTTLEAFEKYLAFDRPAYVKKERMKALDAVRLLRSIGAFPVLAHPFTVKAPDLYSFIQALVKEGLLGVEVEYDYSFMGMNYSSNEVKEMSLDWHLLHTGGSDYHGTIHVTELGSTTVPIEVIEEMRMKVTT